MITILEIVAILDIVAVHSLSDIFAINAKHDTSTILFATHGIFEVFAILDIFAYIYP